MGMDSIMTLQLRNRLEASLGQTLPPTMAFEYPSIEALTRYLATEVLSIELPARPFEKSSGTDRRKEPIERDELSEEDLEELLCEKLKSLQ